MHHKLLSILVNNGDDGGKYPPLPKEGDGLPHERFLEKKAGLGVGEAPVEQDQAQRIPVLITPL